MTTPDISACRDLFRAHPNSALFVTSQLRPRELKMADGLRQLGWKVGLIYYKWTPFEPHAYFDACLAAGSAAEAHQLAMQIAPRICHVFSGAIDDLVLTFCRQKPSPVVIDLNDVFAPSLFDYCHERFEPTREALALADGFCARDLQVKSAEHADGFKLPQRLIFFPEYGWNTESLSDQIAEREASDEVHVVSVGTFSLETQGMYDSCYLQLTRMMIGQGIHFHIYPHWAYRRDHSGSPHAKFEQDFAEFIALQEQNPYLHLHDSLSIEELAKVLPRYDFGLVSGGAPEFGQKLGFYYPAYLETCYSGRISDYLDARLPVLINDEVKFDYWLLKRYGIGIDLKGVLAPGFKAKLLELKRDSRQRQAMERAAQVLSVAANAPRLAAYYQGLMAANGAAMAVQDQAAQPPANGEPIPAIADVSAPPAAAQGVPPTGQLVAAVKAKIRWASPRLAKIILPYRAIRIFEYRLHNALQDLHANSGVIAGLNARVGSLQQETDQSREKIATLEQANGGLASELAARGQENTALSADRTALAQAREALTADLAALQRELSIHASEVAALRLEAHSQRVQISRLEDDKAALNVAAAESHQAKTTLLAELARSEGQRKALGAQVSALETERLAASARLGGLERDKANLGTALADIQQANERLSARLLDLERDKAALNSSVLRLEQDKAAISAGHAELGRQNAALGIATATLERDKLELAARIDGLQQHESELRGTVAELKQERTSLESRLQGLERDKHALDERVAALEEAKAGLVATVAGLEQGKAALSGQVTALEQEKASLRGQVASLEESRASMGAAIAALEQEQAVFRSQVASLEAVRTSMAAAIVNLEQDKADFRSQIASMGEVQTSMRVVIASQEQDKAGFHSQVAGLENDKRTLGSEIASLNQEKLELHAQLAMAVAEKATALVRISELNAEQSRLAIEVTALGNEKAKLESQADQLQAINDHLQMQLDAFDKQVGTLTHEVHVLRNEKFILQQETRWGKMPINEIAGVLNWPEVLNDVERTNGFTDFVRLIGLFTGDTKVANKPSTCWDLLAVKNYDQLLTFGYNNFKRTIGNNYFNFLVQRGDPQLLALEELLPPETLDRCRIEAATLATDPDFPVQDQATYKYFVLLLWEYARTIDAGNYTRILDEPAEGNPIVITARDKRFSQDLANSLIEYYSISEAVDFSKINHVLEIGGGYGRDAFVILSLNPHVKVTMVDIPPALYLAQRYLSSVFNERRVFRAREFSRYAEVKDELGAASIVFLMPHQLALLPKGYFDLSMNISSFGEMDTKQVKWYFKQIERVTAGYFYLKQWRTSNNVFDGVVFKQGDYPYSKNWTQLYARPCSVQSEFFEAMYKVGME